MYALIARLAFAVKEQREDWKHRDSPWPNLAAGKLVGLESASIRWLIASRSERVVKARSQHPPPSSTRTHDGTGPRSTPFFQATATVNTGVPSPR